MAKHLTAAEIVKLAKEGKLSTALVEEEEQTTPARRVVRRVAKPAPVEVEEEEEEPTPAPTRRRAPAAATAEPDVAATAKSAEAEGIQVVQQDGYIWIGLPEEHRPSSSGKTMLVGCTNGPKGTELDVKGRRVVINAMAYYYTRPR